MPQEVVDSLQIETNTTEAKSVLSKGQVTVTWGFKRELITRKSDFQVISERPFLINGSPTAFKEGKLYKRWRLLVL